MALTFSIFTRTPAESEVSQVQLDGKLIVDTDFGLEAVKFGAAYTKQTLSGWGGSNNANAPGLITELLLKYSLIVCLKELI